MKHIAKIFCLLLALTLLAGCGRTAAPTNEPTTGMPNPQKESSEIEILTRFGTVMSLPQGGLVDDYFIIEGENSVAEMRFSLKDSNYVARFMPAAEYEDISGMHYEWQHTETANDLYNTTVRYNDGAEGVIDLYDANLGLVCSLSTDSGADPDTLRSVAKEVFAPVTDGFGSGRVDGLNALLDDVREHYFPGTAGSSLSGAACAAKLADYFAETGIDPDRRSRTRRECSLSSSLTAWSLPSRPSPLRAARAFWPTAAMRRRATPGRRKTSPTALPPCSAQIDKSAIEKK